MLATSTSAETAKVFSLSPPLLLRKNRHENLAVGEFENQHISDSVYLWVAPVLYIDSSPTSLWSGIHDDAKSLEYRTNDVPVLYTEYARLSTAPNTVPTGFIANSKII